MNVWLDDKYDSNLSCFMSYRPDCEPWYGFEVQFWERGEADTVRGRGTVGGRISVVDVDWNGGCTTANIDHTKC